MNRIKTLVALCLALALSACSSYVPRDEYDSTIADLRAADSSLAATDESLKGQLARMQAQFGELTANLQDRFAAYDAEIADLQGRVRVDMSANFAYDDATLRDQDKEALAEFSEIMQSYSPNVVVTVEGFTDPAGSVEYNKWLGMERAKAVRAYLIETGMSPDAVRAVSYGEDAERQLKPGKWGKSGDANRRVALVVDYIAG